MTARADISVVMDVLQHLPDDEEVRRLKADNERMSMELQFVREELQVDRRDIAEEAEKRREQRSEPVAAPSQLPEVTSLDSFEELKAFILRLVGPMVDARIEGLEMRLPPAPPMRPSLVAYTYFEANAGSAATGGWTAGGSCPEHSPDLVRSSE